MLQPSSESGPIEELRSHVLEHARHGVRLLEASLRTGLCRYYTPVTTFCVLHLCDAVARYSPDPRERSKTALLCLEILEQNRASCKICGPLQQMFRRVMSEYDIELPADVDERYGPLDQFSMDEILDAGGRLSYRQPTKQINRWIHPNFWTEWGQEWDKQMSQETTVDGPVPERSMKLADVLNR